MKRIIMLWVFVMITLTLTTFVLSRTYEGVEFVEGIDGDTATFAFPQTNESYKMVVLSPRSVRLWGVDSPELSEEHGELCRFMLKDILQNFSHFTLIGKGSSYGRQVAIVLGRRSVPAGDNTAFDIAKYMVYAGCAVDVPEYSNGYYQEAQDEAESKKYGMWAD